MRLHPKWLGVGIGCAVALTTAGPASASPTVSLDEGAARGRTAGAVNQYLGLPYAAAPVGSRRWRAPQPAPHWRGVRNATKPAPHCAQPGTPFGLASTSEDCLYLNVYAPAHQRKGRGSPVLVWIHGGGLWLGESEDYDGSKFAAEGTIVVSVNYRLGALGFLAHPALADRRGASGNYGWMDQQEALRWVKRNIAAFGGDPRRVTIGGHSAGALSVLAQLVSPGAKGLFSGAIVQSGAFALAQTPLADAEAEGTAFAAKAGCADQRADCLRGLPVASVLANQRNIPTGYTPGVLDGTVLTRTVADALRTGRFNRVPILNGTSHDEWRLFVGLEELQGQPVTGGNYEQRIASTLGVQADAAAYIASRYPLSAQRNPGVALGAIGTDAIFACPGLGVDQTASNYVPTFAYEFNDTSAPQRFLAPVSFSYGAPHIAETQYLFDLPTAPFTARLNARQRALAATMREYWAGFVARGVPSASWPQFHNHSHRVLSLQSPRPRVRTDFAAAHNCALWDR